MLEWQVSNWISKSDDEGALSILMSLIDQLHGIRHQMRVLVRAVEAELEEVRERIKQLLEGSDNVPK